MRRSLIAFGAALLVVLIGATVARAANEVNVRVVMPSTQLNPCANELIDSLAKVHVVVNFTINGNNVSGTFHLNFSVKSVGQTTGATYTGSEAVNEPFSASLVNGRSVVPVVNRFILTSPGGGNNWVFVLMTHVIVNANGEVTASFESLKDGICV